MNSQLKAKLDAELKQLNDAVALAIAARRKWMDEHMQDYAKYSIGEMLYLNETGMCIGKVSSLYRYHQGNDALDDNMSINYKLYVHGNYYDNTSRYGGAHMFSNRAELAERLEREAARLRT